jgi:hypothetical protein
MIHTALMMTETGQKQWEKAYGSDNEIQMNLVDEKLKDQDTGKDILGNASRGFIKNSGGLAVGVKRSRIIKISLPNIKESKANEGLSLVQAIGATAGHEIEHTTEKNGRIAIGNKNYGGKMWRKKDSKARIERDPTQIGRKIRRESRINNQNEPNKIERSNSGYNIDTSTLR